MAFHEGGPDYCGPSEHARRMGRRTPADIGTEIAAYQAEIAALKDELASIPPKVLELRSYSLNAPIAFRPSDYKFGGLEVDTRGATNNTYTSDEVERLRDWLNHYYPAEEGS